MQTGLARGRRADFCSADMVSPVVSCSETAHAGYMKPRAGWKGVHRRPGTPEGLLHTFRYKTVPQLRVLRGK